MMAETHYGKALKPGQELRYAGSRHLPAFRYALRVDGEEGIRGGWWSREEAERMAEFYNEHNARSGGTHRATVVEL
jgi:hypothetical protein